ncbi:hypothetical protein ACJMK2_041264 [Sinanodonta woodiana]|uniref:ATP synthase F(1) complex subunit delta, mitochondrial n=1 Tax=Sinanodonta woodiana TaxID=1069815 RepID=A0ABD3W6S5_SINWO
MALPRQLARTPALLQKCHRLAVRHLQGKRNYADMAFTFASPNEVFYRDVKVKQVDVPSFNGSFGILPDHVPTLAVLRPGVLTVLDQDGNAKKYFVSSGSVTVNPDSSVQILAEEAHPLDRLDAHAIRDGANKAQQEVSSAPNEKARAEAQVAVECYEALLKAVE